MDRARAPGDIELSHWVPNQTDPRYKADSSTEICLNYVADPNHVTADLVVNDHLDLDGVLSLFALMHPEIALSNRADVIAAAEVGDFLGWADWTGFRLSQELWRGLRTPEASAADPTHRYEIGFELTVDLLTGEGPTSPATEAGWARIQAGLKMLEDRTVATEIVHERLVSFVFPKSMPADVVFGVPALNQLIDDSIALWPQARNRDHGQRMQLLSLPAGDGRWLHDLWAPTYSWADTPYRWRMPGLASTGDSNRWRIDDPEFDGAIEALVAAETAPGSWRRAKHLTNGHALEGRRFPVVLSFCDESGHRSPSSLTPPQVSDALAPVWSRRGDSTPTPARSVSTVGGHRR